MAIKLGATGITFQDNSVQTTAGGPVTTLYAIGSYTIGRPATANTVSVDTTIAGSSLYMTSMNASYAFQYDENSNFQSQGFFPIPGIGNSSSQSVITVGSWRCLSTAYAISGEGTRALPGLWVRYA
jgi:hypothetical protein